MADHQDSGSGKTRPDGGRIEGAAHRDAAAASDPGDNLLVLLAIAVVVTVSLALLLPQSDPSPDQVAAPGASDGGQGAESGEDGTGGEPEAGGADQPASAAGEQRVTVTVDATGGSYAVTVAATQEAITMSGLVPRTGIADDLRGAAMALFTPPQVRDELELDPAPPDPEANGEVVVTVVGSTTDPVLFARLEAELGAIRGITTLNTDRFSLTEPSELETTLNSFDQIQFASGSTVILPVSEQTLDQIAQQLSEHPTARIEIGCHTDSRGSAEANQSLSRARADAVQAALEARDVTNELVVRGFGESRLKVRPDNTAEAQQSNRRVELRVLDP